ncbi:MAG: hypothetical protein HY904_03865 [Deltaproteobacteria bacterium]|nr:hypothetical protein [Deltaproteobacteria bacterium]
MVRLVSVVLALGLLGAAGVVVWKDVGGARTAGVRQVTAWLDGLLGVHPRDGVRPPAREAAPVRKPAPRAAAPRAAAEPLYVDRSPMPSALERVRPEDRRALDDIIAQKLAHPRAAESEGGARGTR